MKQRKWIALFLTVLLTLSALPMSAMAVSVESPEAYAAKVLNQLGLFEGVGKAADGSPNFDLLRAPSREEAVTMLVRLLGKDAAAKSGSYKTPFTDVSDWAKPYVGYAYQNKLTLGTGASTFGGRDTVTTAQYLTFVLRALGYSSETDFTWSAAWKLSDTLGITFGEYDAKTTDFNRGDVAIVSASALGAPMKNSGDNLLSFLKASGALAKSTLVLMDVEVVACRAGNMSFAFFPIPGSPNTYSSFQIDSVTVNGLPCTIQQYKTAKDAKTFLPAIGSLYPNSFNYSILSYDEAAAKKAAQHTVDQGGGHTFPILVFSFTATGTLTDGTKTQEVFSEAVYIDGYGQNS